MTPVERATALTEWGMPLAWALADHEHLPGVRLALLTYWTWACGEFAVHKWFMHAPVGSWADKVTHINTLHVVHHADTHKDMTMKKGFSVHALYFHAPNTLLQVAVGTAVLTAMDGALNLGIPVAWTVASSAVFAVTHSLLWNTMHMDMHQVSDPISDGAPNLTYQRKMGGLAGDYVQWVFDNHTTHHDVGGGMNYNVVCPGPDFLFGTYLRRSRQVVL